MRTVDLLTLPIAALWQQKMRTVLTTLGVVFGAFVLAASLSIGEGVQETMARESRRNEVARRIDVYSKANPAEVKTGADEITVEGTLGKARRERLRKANAEKAQQANSIQARTVLSGSMLGKIAAIPHVDRVIPMTYSGGFAILGEKSVWTQVISARPDSEPIRRRLVAGRFFKAPDERAVVVSEFLAYRLGLTTDSDIDGLVGKKLRLEFRPQNLESGFRLVIMKSESGREERAALDKVVANLPGSLEKLGLSGPEVEVLRKGLGGQPAPEVFSEEYTVIGVTRPPSDEERIATWDYTQVESDVLLPYQTAADLYLRFPGSEVDGVNNAYVLVDDEKEVKEVVESLLGLGVQARAAIEFIERERLIYLLIFGGMTCVAGVALLVSSLGIANTMLMSVLERKREIGIMKAVGADDRHLLSVFLVEGALIGLAGAALGLLLAWGASFPADAWVRTMILRDLKVDLESSIFVFPAWIGATVVLFTVLVTTVAAYYPARHAAKVDPVTALRHE
ncbi:ABC transporter permease [Isosphaeraceae bacterium EP7]